MAREVRRTKGQPKKPLMSRRTRITLLVAGGIVAVVAGGIWAWFTLTTIPPPDVKVASAQEITEFLGNDRGFARMPVQQREEYLVQSYQRFSQGAGRDDFNRSLRRMSKQERTVFLDAFFEVGKEKLVTHAREYNRISNPVQKRRYIEQAAATMEGIRRNLGGANRDQSLGEPFKNDLPTNGEEFTKRLVTLTSPKERSEADRLFNDLVAYHQETHR